MILNKNESMQKAIDSSIGKKIMTKEVIISNAETSIPFGPDFIKKDNYYYFPNNFHLEYIADGNQILTSIDYDLKIGNDALVISIKNPEAFIQGSDLYLYIIGFDK